MLNIFRKFKIQTFNKIITGIIIFATLWLIISPFLPEIEYMFNYLFGPKIVSFEDEKEYIKEYLPNSTDNTSSTTQQSQYKNRILIPAVQINTELYKSNNDSTLNYGAWWLESSGSLNKNGNIVITGHKYIYYSGLRPFYHLYKTEIGDMVYLVWNGEVYQYEIVDNFVVYSNAKWIEEPTLDKKVLTIYTCEGLDSSQRRVIRANYVGKFNE